LSPAKKFQGEAQAGGQKGRWLGGRNFCPPAFERRHGGRGVWGEFHHAGANTKRGRTRRLLCQEQKPAKKFSSPIKRKKWGAEKNKKCNEKISVLVCRSEAEASGNAPHYSEFCSKKVRISTKRYRQLEFCKKESSIS